MANVTLTNKAKIVILFANQYDMKDEAGNKLSGCSVHYMFWGENGEVLASEAQFDPTQPVGVQRAKCSVDSVPHHSTAGGAAREQGNAAGDIGNGGENVRL